MKYSTLKRLEKLNYVYFLALVIAAIFGWTDILSYVMFTIGILIFLALSNIYIDLLADYEWAFEELLGVHEAEMAYKEMSTDELDKYMTLALKKEKENKLQLEKRTKESLEKKIKEFEKSE